MSVGWVLQYSTTYYSAKGLGCKARIEYSKSEICPKRAQKSCGGKCRCGIGDEVGGVWGSGRWSMGIFLAKNGVYRDRGGGV